VVAATQYMQTCNVEEKIFHACMHVWIPFYYLTINNNLQLNTTDRMCDKFKISNVLEEIVYSHIF
jgi:hypothetical protein